MTRETAITLTKALFAGLLLGSLLPTVLPLSIITACIIIAVVLFILIVAARSDVVYALVGVLIGGLLAFFVSQLHFEVSNLTAIVLVFAVAWL